MTHDGNQQPAEVHLYTDCPVCGTPYCKLESPVTRERDKADQVAADLSRWSAYLDGKGSLPASDIQAVSDKLEAAARIIERVRSLCEPRHEGQHEPGPDLHFGGSFPCWPCEIARALNGRP